MREEGGKETPSQKRRQKPKPHMDSHENTNVLLEKLFGDRGSWRGVFIKFEISPLLGVVSLMVEFHIHDKY